MTNAQTSIAPQSEKPREARLVLVQDDNGLHLCTGFVKEITAKGEVVFEEQGQKVLTYGAYEVAIQDLEICLAFAKAQREARLKATQEAAAPAPEQAAAN